MNPTYSELFNRAWNNMKDNLAFNAGLALVTFMGSWFFNLIPIVGAIFAGLLSASYMYCLYKMKKGEVIGYKDFFWAFLDLNLVIKILILNSIVVFATIVSFLLLIIPGIWWMVAGAFSTPVFVIRNQDPVGAIKDSMNIVKDRWWYFFGLGCLVVLVNIVGALCFLIGLLVSLPLSAYLAIEVVEHFYSQVTAPAGDQQSGISPEPPPIA